MESILIGIIVFCLVLLLRKFVFACVLILFGCVVIPVYFVTSLINNGCSRIMKYICYTIIKMAGYTIEEEETNKKED